MILSKDKRLRVRLLNLDRWNRRHSRPTGYGAEAYPGRAGKTGWRLSGDGGAAEALGLKRTTLHERMKKLGIKRPNK